MRYLEAVEQIREAQHLLICAGAGMGVDSGLPDFRGNAGFWRAYPEYHRLGLAFSDLANPEAFDRDPELGWGFYGHRLELYRRIRPHEGFALLRNWASAKRSHFVLTSNVDGHFQQAGFAEDRLFEIHGSIHHWQCSVPCQRLIFPERDFVVRVDHQTMRAIPPLPRCPSCGKIARPNILMFGDGRWIEDRSIEQEDYFGRWIEGVGQEPLTILELGAGTYIPSVRLLSEELVRRQGARLVRINSMEAHVPAGQIGIAAGSLAALRMIQSLLNWI